jgi:hypothetical protein
MRIPLRLDCPVFLSFESHATKPLTAPSITNSVTDSDLRKKIRLNAYNKVHYHTIGVYTLRGAYTLNR